jgi:hypothetical protein
VIAIVAAVTVVVIVAEVVVAVLVVVPGLSTWRLQRFLGAV